MNKNNLWSKNFTIITLGSAVSMLGNAMSGFGMGLLVLDYTNSVFLYSISMIVYALPKLVVPILAGPYLDRFSRRKVIYTLDFISAVIFLFLFMALSGNFFNYPLLLICSFVVGSIDSIYMVAYDSLYPNLVSKGNMSKAYSISSILYPFAACMVPIAAMVYERVGLAPIFLFNAISFLIAAIAETQIVVEEKHIDINKVQYDRKSYLTDFKNGIKYIMSEKGLLAITVYFAFIMMCDAPHNTLLMPYFKDTPALGVTLYTYVMGANVFGRLIGGMMHYRSSIPVQHKFKLALFVYVFTTLLTMSLLFLPVPLMIVNQFMMGILSVTSYNIRISSTQNHVPDEYRARFNSTFSIICNLGLIGGQLIAGVLGELLPIRNIVVMFAMISLMAIAFIMVPNRKHVAKIYNREV